MRRQYYKTLLLINRKSMMDIIIWIIAGVVAGFVASFVARSDSRRSMMVPDIGAGFFGALIGGWLSSYFIETGAAGFDYYGALAAVIGAIVLIVIARVVQS
jgi:uncharacterized membrane protein YeaQ/YmgE (transglycosylase-associated protein family)